MTTKSAEHLWKLYPEGRLHCDVTEAGSAVYKVVVSMINRDGKIVGTVEHIGSGDLAQLKDQALEKLIAELEQH